MNISFRQGRWSSGSLVSLFFERDKCSKEDREVIESDIVRMRLLSRFNFLIETREEIESGRDVRLA